MTADLDLAWEPAPGALELLERGELDEHVPRPEVLDAGGASRGGLGLDALRDRWRAIVTRLRGYESDAVVVKDEPAWVPLAELLSPEGGRAQLTYEWTEEKEGGARLEVLGIGFGSSMTATLTRSLSFEAEGSPKALQVKAMITATRYHARGGGAPLLRVDVRPPSTGPEHRLSDAPRTAAPLDDPAVETLEWVRLADLDDEGTWTATHRAESEASWSADLGIPTLTGLGVTAGLSLRCRRASGFEAVFELPYGADYVFYRRTSETPLVPACAVVPPGRL